MPGSNSIGSTEIFQEGLRIPPLKLYAAGKHDDEVMPTITGKKLEQLDEEFKAFLRKRYDALQRSPLFAGMEYTEEAGRIAAWIPLTMEGRDSAQWIRHIYGVWRAGASGTGVRWPSSAWPDT